MSRHATTAYQNTAKAGVNNRELEAMILMRAATRLKSVQDNWDDDQSDLQEALVYNRKLWTILSVSATDTENDLPDEIKRNIALIAIFIFNRLLDMISDPSKEGLDALIDINRNIAQGLMSKPQIAEPLNETAHSAISAAV